MVHASSLLLFAAAALAKVDKLNDAAFKEAQQRDDTATRAVSNARITTADGKCLFIDLLGGDFRANLAPVQIGDCTQSQGLGFDVITAGKHNNQKGQALVVSTLSQACLNFDDRRKPGDQVIMFSCGGRADGEGQVTNSQLFAFDGKTQNIQMKPENGNGKCLVADGERVSIAQCDTNDKKQLFMIGGNDGGGAQNTGKGGDNNSTTQTKDDNKTKGDQKTKTKDNNKTKTKDQARTTQDQGNTSQSTALASQTQDACSGKLETVYNYITVTMEVPGGEASAVASQPSVSEVVVQQMTTSTAVESAATTEESKSKDMSKESKTKGMGKDNKTKGMDKDKGMGKDNKTKDMGKDNKTKDMGKENKTKDMGKDNKTKGMGQDTKTKGMDRGQTTLIKQTRTKGMGSQETATATQSDITTTGSASAKATNTGVPIPVARGGFIDSDAADKAHQEDTTATVQDALKAVHIKTSANKCLEFDTLQGDSLQNLLPLNIVDCRPEASFQKFDMSSRSKNNDGKAGKVLVIGDEFPSCLMFDNTRAKDDQVNMFSCGGVADGSDNRTDNRQLFTASNGTDTLQLTPFSDKSICFSSKQGKRVVAEKCNGSKEQTFTIAAIV